jgi:hypothetical protein
VSESPAVAAKSSLHVRVTSNTGTPLATATTSCELKAIIETEIAILVTPYPVLPRDGISGQVFQWERTALVYAKSDLQRRQISGSSFDSITSRSH